MKRLAKSIPGRIVGLALSLVVLLLILNIASQLSMGIALFILVPFGLALVSIFIPVKNIAVFMRSWSIRHKKIALILAVVAIVATILLRFGFGLLTYFPTSDPGSFFVAAESLALTGKLSNPIYVATYPYLFTYDALLGFGMKLFGVGIFQVILINTIFDLTAACLLYLLVRRITKRGEWGFVAGLLYFLSPTSIIFSVLSLPLSLFNALFVASLLALHALSQQRTTKAIVVMSLVTGIIFAGAESVRPVMIVFIIALSLLYIVRAIRASSKIEVLNLATSLIIVFMTFTAINQVHRNIISSVTGIESAQSSGGWSMYVGTNIDTWGRWNVDDRIFGDKIQSDHSNLTAYHKALQHEALERVKSYSPQEILELLMRKAVVLGGDQKSMHYNLYDYPAIVVRPTLYEAIRLSFSLYIYILLALSLLYLYQMRQNKRFNKEFTFVHLILLIFIGLFAAQLLVEVANRYFASFIVLLVILATLGTQVLSSIKLERTS